MASAFSHAVAALSIGTCFYQPQIPKRVWVAGALCSVLPDVDVIGFASASTTATSGVIAALPTRSRLLLYWRASRQR
jgi:hypothetical protein